MQTQTRQTRRAPTRPVTHRRTNYSGYALTDSPALIFQLAERGIFARFHNLVAEHVTHRYPDLETAPTPKTVRIVGHALGDGVDTLVAEVDGSTRRPDGKLYHVTFSLDEGHRPVESNALLADGHYTPIDPIEVEVEAF